MPVSDLSASPPGTWAPVRRAAVALAAPIQRILAVEAASGIALLAATALALVWANVSPATYDALWHTPIGGRLGPWLVERPLEFWVNEGLMTIFFFVVGLEIRREMFEGELASARNAALPVAAAIGGMLMPAVIFAVLNIGRAGAAGWAIPMATDIAFAVGVLTVLGPRVPPALRVLLLALAVIDDIGAIVVIAVFYNDAFAPVGLLAVAAGVGLAWILRTAGIRAPLVYVPAGVLVWCGFLAAGIHPTIAGVVLGLLTPVRPWFGPSGFAATTQAHLDDLPVDDRGALLATLDRIDEARREAVSPAERLIHALHPWVAFGVMPLFALANAGVALDGVTLGGASAWVFAGIVAGLVLGKPLGIAAFARVATKLGIASRPPEVTRRGVLLVGCVGGIGFTMSLFIAQLAFPAGPLLDTAKLAILVGSGIVIVLALAFGVLARADGGR
jgi:Na+:H+ antiporter, NhaA family